MKLLSFSLLFSIEAVFLSGEFRFLSIISAAARPNKASNKAPCTIPETFKNIFHAGGEGGWTFLSWYLF